MRIYADHPDRRASQLISDVVAVVSCVASVAVGQSLRTSIETLAEPAGRLESTGSSLAEGLSDAADSLSGVPLIGDSVGDALQRAADAANGVRSAGASTIELVERTAAIIGVLVPALVVVIVILAWLRPRVRWVQDADDARAVKPLADGADLLAVKALAKVRMYRLSQYDTDLVARWRDGDPAATRTLARAELDRLGLD